MDTLIVMSVLNYGVGEYIWSALEPWRCCLSKDDLVGEDAGDERVEEKQSRAHYDCRRVKCQIGTLDSLMHSRELKGWRSYTTVLKALAI